ncbi:SusC/RagA family TonB-linked outer membrane protein [Plebeiibacterium sediminum]|uniref:TonB-dependent receptor n=1 Tax=Plebeiibacterium sediminum TaxID=2992112 RepID=A0AAE3M6G6_9BACT|nr:TonB-dependent receptor [Plebeiobacterium sediminum]MCW3787659.1 TonB-dependent receptor [Plebeiobacterium sediminum]
MRNSIGKCTGSFIKISSGIKEWMKKMLVGTFLFLSIGIMVNAETDFNVSVTDQENTVSISGNVKDENGEPIPGVSIIQKGSSNGTITDIDGNYTIKVNLGSTIVFSFIGMTSQEIVVSSPSPINVFLKSESIGLDDVVVVGYGTQKKATLTGSVETVKAEVFEDRAVTSPALALQGQTPGLVVTRSSSRPGKESIDFQIRGATSVNGGSPLIVIDGSPAINDDAFNSMNAEDIESITILKDGSAAIYGSRAANGVILVTTKKGKGETKVEINSQVMFNTLGIRPPTPTMEEYATVWLEAAEQDGAQANYWGWQTKENLLRMQTGEEGIYSTQYWGDIFLGDYPRFDEMYGSSLSQQQNVSLSGSSEKSSYRISGGYLENRGLLQTAYDGKAQYNLRMNYDYEVTKWLKLETGVSYFNTEVQNPSSGFDASSISNDPPFFPSKNPYGQWYANFGIAGNRNAVAATVDGGKETTKRDQLKLNFAATVNITKDLSLKGTASFDKDFYYNQNYKLTVPQYTWFGELAPESVNSTSSISEKTSTVFYKTYGGFANYNKKLGNHEISAMIGITAELNENKTLYGYRKGFEDLGVYDINMGSTEELVEATGGQGHWGLYGYVGRLNYNYMNKYLVEVNGRRDGSSKFAPGYKWSNFMGGSLGWVITEENFLKDNNFLSYLKLRASYGEMGNQVGISNYDYVSTMGYGTAIFGTTAAQQNSAWVSGITSNTRTWERVSNLTVGTDFQLMQGKVYGSFDYFIKKNDGMLISVNYPDVLGGSAPKSNSGSLETKGWEAALGYRNKIGGLEYNVSVNIGDTRNELIKMEGVSTYSAGKNSTVQGYALNSWFLYKTDGFFADEDEVTAYYEQAGNGGEIPNSSDANVRLRPGDTRKVDLDESKSITGTGNIDDKNGDVKYMGDAAAHYNFGVNIGLKYKNFDLTGFFQGVLDQKILRSGYLQYPFYTVWSNQPSAYIGKTWTEDNTSAKYPRMTYNTTRSKWNWANNDFMLQNNRYVRLKSLVVGYTFKDIKVDKYKIERLRIYFSGNDLFEFTSLKDGYDPEYGESTQNSYPFNRTYAIGVNLSF